VEVTFHVAPIGTVRRKDRHGPNEIRHFCLPGWWN
jgi:hypothetical protein